MRRFPRHGYTTLSLGGLAGGEPAPDLGRVALDTPSAQTPPQADAENILSCPSHGTELSATADLQQFSSRLQRLVNLSGVAIAVEQNGAFVCVASSGDSAPALGTVLDRNRGLSAECLRTGETKVCNDALADLRVNREVCRKMGIHSIVVVPLMNRGIRFGVVAVFADRQHFFHERHLFLLEFVASFITRSIEQQRDEAARIAPPEPSFAPIQLPAAEAIPHAPLPTSAPAVGQSVWFRRVSGVVLGAVAAVALAATVISVTSALRDPHSVLEERGSQTSEKPANTALPFSSSSSSSGMRTQSSSPAGTLAFAESFTRWSAPGYTRITLNLDRAPEVRCGRLLNPARLYCDLRGLKLKASESEQQFESDPLVTRMRVGQFEPGVVRIVFDLRSESLRHAVTVLSTPPRLLVEVLKPEVGRQERSELSEGKGSGISLTDSTEAAALTIAIDPGHGGHDNGSVGLGGLKEKDLVLDVAERFAELLRNRMGARVIFTRSDDRFLPLEQRSAIANEAHADLFVSIHGNASLYRPAQGIETYYMGDAASSRDLKVAEAENQHGAETRSHQFRPARESGAPLANRTSARRLALDVQAALLAAAARAGSVRDRGVRTAPFVVLRNANMPAILAEISFVSSRAEERRLSQPAFRQRLAEGLYQGVATNLARRKKNGTYTASTGSPSTLSLAH